MVHDVTDVPISPSSVVTELFDVSSCSCCSDWDCVEPQSFSFYKKRIWTTAQEEMRYEDSLVKAPPPSKRSDAAHTTAKFIQQEHYQVDSQIGRAREKAPWRQSSPSSSNERQWQVGMEGHCARSSPERKLVRAAENYLESSADIQGDVGVLERLIEPEEEKVCLRYTLKYSTRKGSSIFQFFDTSEKKGPSCCKQKTLVGAPKRKGSYARKVAK